MKPLKCINLKSTHIIYCAKVRNLWNGIIMVLSCMAVVVVHGPGECKINSLSKKSKKRRVQWYFTYYDIAFLHSSLFSLQPLEYHSLSELSLPLLPHPHICRDVKTPSHSFSTIVPPQIQTHCKRNYLIIDFCSSKFSMQSLTTPQLKQTISHVNQFIAAKCT